MRRQDLRKFDVHLMTSILSVFCLASFVFLVLWMTNFFTIAGMDLKTMLWVSYSVFFIVTLIVYLATKQPNIVWVKPEAAKKIDSSMKYKVLPGQSFLFKESKSLTSRDAFADSVSHGKQGIFVTRSNPVVLKKEMDISNTQLLWLTEVETENAINPLDIEDVSYYIKKFLKNTSDPIVLLEGVEYLINILPFNKVLHFIQDLRDEIALRNAVLLMKLDPDLMDVQQLKLIEKEFSELNKNGP